MQSRLDHQKKIKICFVSPKAYPLFNPNIRATFGGAEVDLYYLGTELAKDPNYEVCFIVADYGQDDVEVYDGATVIQSLDFQKNAIRGGLKIWNALNKADADIYMIKSISAGLFLVALFCRLYRKIFVYRTAHATHCDGRYLKRHPLMGKLFIHSLQQAALVFAQNEVDKHNLKKTTGHCSIVIPNGHRIAVASTREKKTILWVGRSAEFKHPGCFLELAKAFPQERFVMICQKATGDRDYDILRRKAGEIENLVFYEHISFAETDRFFAAAKVFVNTSDSEGFPNTFIQACKAGTAILSYTVNPDDFLNRHDCGRCAGGTFESLISTLRALLTDELYIEFGQNGLHYVQKTHNVETIVQQYKQFFNNLADTSERL